MIKKSVCRLEVYQFATGMHKYGGGVCFSANKIAKFLGISRQYISFLIKEMVAGGVHKLSLLLKKSTNTDFGMLLILRHYLLKPFFSFFCRYIMDWWVVSYGIGFLINHALKLPGEFTWYSNLVNLEANSLGVVM